MTQVYIPGVGNVETSDDSQVQQASQQLTNAFSNGFNTGGQQRPTGFGGGLAAGYQAFQTGQQIAQKFQQGWNNRNTQKPSPVSTATPTPVSGSQGDASNPVSANASSPDASGVSGNVQSVSAGGDAGSPLGTQSGDAGSSPVISNTSCTPDMNSLQNFGLDNGSNSIQSGFGSPSVPPIMNAAPMSPISAPSESGGGGGGFESSNISADE